MRCRCLRDAGWPAIGIVNKRRINICFFVSVSSAFAQRNYTRWKQFNHSNAIELFRAIYWPQKSICRTVRPSRGFARKKESRDSRTTANPPMNTNSKFGLHFLSFRFVSKTICVDRENELNLIIKRSSSVILKRAIQHTLRTNSRTHTRARTSSCFSPRWKSYSPIASFLFALRLSYRSKSNSAR